MSATGTSLPAPSPSLRAVVVIPARDEQVLIGRCLEALTQQCGVARGSYELIAVLDGCRDGTREVLDGWAARMAAPAIHCVELPSHAGVGRARRTGMDLACERLLAVGRSDGLIASTDADSVVARDWLIRQLELVELGAMAIGGKIDLFDEEQLLLAPAALAERDLRATRRLREARERLPAGATGEHHQFSGASLALTAATYERCGGLPVRAALEDEALEAELGARGVPIHRSAAVRVMTSARIEGRAPRGLARDLARSDWRARRTHRASEFPLRRLLAAKSATIGLILPAREVAATIGPVAERAAALQRAGLLDEVLVVDARSRDATAAVAARAGLEVVQEDELSRELGPCSGKGDAMWRGMRELGSEILAFADTDTEDFGEQFLTGLLGPLVCEPDVQFVKGFFRRPFRGAVGAVSPHGGGRVTELMARPLLNLHAPALAVFDQPLAGETAGRRELLEAIPFSAGYGVEIAMLIDAWRLAGLNALAQVDLGVRQNRHQTLRDLSAMAYAVLVAAQSRLLGPEFADAHAAASIALPPADGEQSMELRGVVVHERPALRTLPQEGETSAAALSQNGEKAVAGLSGDAV